MNKLLLVGMGGFVGSVLRYVVSGYAQQLARNATFPIGTLFVNTLGCLIIGFLSGLADQRAVLTPEVRLLVFVGMLGGFTTFSTFSNESFNLLQDNELLAAAVNLSAHLLLGLAAVWAGRALAYWFWK